MSRAHAIQPLGVPVLSVDEQVVFVPPTGHSVINRARKLLFYLEASCCHTLAEMPDTSRVSLEAGDILVLPYSCRQRYESHTSATTRLHALRLILDPEILPPLSFIGGDKSTFSTGSQPPSNPSASSLALDTTHFPTTVAEFVAIHFNQVLHLSGGITTEMRETLARLRREADHNDQSSYGSGFRVGAACVDLLVLVARQLEHNPSVSPTSSGRGTFRVEEVREFVIKHLDTPMSLSIIAAHLELSPEHLSRVWKATTGITLFDFVRRTRIERAKTLLTASDANMSQIAALCGFSSLSLFSRTFKADTQVSPTQYRERLMK